MSAGARSQPNIGKLRDERERTVGASQPCHAIANVLVARRGTSVSAR
jgi:hypothetical protein